VAWGWVAVVGRPVDAETMVAGMVIVVMGSWMVVGFAAYAVVALVRQGNPRFRRLPPAEQARRRRVAELLRHIERPTPSHGG
jgi:hypothetical protein